MTQLRKQSRPRTPKLAMAVRGALDATITPALFKALSDPTRVHLLTCIAKCGRGCTVGEVAECCSVDISVVSRHLALLARAGALEPSKEGRTVRYRVRYEEVCASLRAMANAFEQCCPGGGCGDGACC